MTPEAISKFLERSAVAQRTDENSASHFTWIHMERGGAPWTLGAERARRENLPRQLSPSMQGASADVSPDTIRALYHRRLETVDATLTRVLDTLDARVASTDRGAPMLWVLGAEGLVLPRRTEQGTTVPGSYGNDLTPALLRVPLYRCGPGSVATPQPSASQSLLTLGAEIAEWAGLELPLRLTRQSIDPSGFVAPSELLLEKQGLALFSALSPPGQMRARVQAGGSGGAPPNGAASILAGCGRSSRVAFGNARSEA